MFISNTTELKFDVLVASPVSYYSSLDSDNVELVLAPWSNRHGFLAAFTQCWINISCYLKLWLRVHYSLFWYKSIFYNFFERWFILTWPEFHQMTQLRGSSLIRIFNYQVACSTLCVGLALAGQDDWFVETLSRVDMNWWNRGLEASRMWIYLFNPLTAKLFNLNFHPLEVVCRWRDPNFKWVKIIQIWQNGGQLFSNLAGWCHILSLTYLKFGT